MMLVTGACHLFSDCANVVRDWNNPSKQYDLKRAYGNFTCFLKKSPKADSICSLSWVKAHQDLSKDTGNAEHKVQAKGNDAVDKLAKAGRELHPQPSVTQANEVN